MTLNDFRTLYEHNDWANDRLLAMLTRAFGEETDLRAADDARVRTIQETTTHIVAAQAVWRRRWEGEVPKTMLDPAEYPTPLALRMAFGAERARFWRFFEEMTEDDVARVIHTASTTGEPRILPLGQMMHHVATHSVYHRGQVTGLLLSLGHEDAVVSTDILGFYLEK